ncbi:MAG: hypothetical protein A4S09_11100 [Proteobacteria bacterium SG_bin7]|nr:MAG: hypothetical protein A4S09_11100 [Proteobacteria bacterium SG_bin7]
MIYISIYRFFYSLVFIPGIFLMGLFDKKIKKGLALRKKQSGTWPWLNFQKKSAPIWIHASSMEFEYAKPIIREIKNKTPDVKILVTFFSPSAENAIKNFPGVDFACASPWDIPGVLKEFIAHHQPKALLLARTDTWPEMLFQCREKRIPTLLFSSTFAKSSSRNRFGLRGFYAWVFSLLKTIYVVGDEDLETYRSLGIMHTEKVGDTRYDQVFYRLQNQKKFKSQLMARRDDIVTFIAGSTWPEDEKQICFAIKDLVKFEVKARYIVVPHEPTPTHIYNLERGLQGCNYVLYSRLEDPLEAGQILIVDHIGILAELYSISDIAFIGGSFKKNIHSVMEALACGCLAIVGPYHHNNREALEFKKLNAVREVSSFNEIDKAIRDFVRLSKSERRDIREHIESLARARKGSTEKIMKWLS